METLKSGIKAPEFTLSDQEGKVVSLNDFKGRKLLIYFYPKADTPGCTKQSCALSDVRNLLKTQGVDIVGISPDPPVALLKFHRKYKLGFPLLSDESHAAAKAYGVWGKKSMYGNTYMGIIRSSFLVDEKGKVSDAWYKVSPANTVPKALKSLNK